MHFLKFSRELISDFGITDRGEFNKELIWVFFPNNSGKLYFPGPVCLL